MTDIDSARLRAWIIEAVDPAVTSITVTRLVGRHSSGAWRIDASGETHAGWC